MGGSSVAVVETDDLDEIDAFLNRAYATAVVDERRDRSGLLRVVRGQLGPMNVDEVDLGLDLHWQSDPAPALRLSRVNSGVVHQRLRDGSTDSHGPGDVMFVGEPNRPFGGRCQFSHFDVILLDPVLLDRVAATAPSRNPEPVRMIGHRPVSAAANRRVARAITYLHTLALMESDSDRSPLTVATAADHVSAVVLDSFPNTALTEPTIEDHHDSTPALLRRATAFIDDNAHTDISLADIAAASYVSPRALQYMFRKHLDCTPTDYVRKVRLHLAHLDLLAGSWETTSVAEIARRRGFNHIGRFASYYRRPYGRRLRDTLRGP